MTRLRRTPSTGVGKAGAPETGRTLPPRSSARLLPFNKVPDEEFEHLCDELVGFEPGIVSTDLKRTGGVAQYGVDVEGFDDRHRPVLVLSAKRYQKATASNLRDWVDDFLKHWETHWCRRGVRRFVIAVTVETNSDALQERITADTDRLAVLGVKYEVWGTNQLTRKIRPHPEVVVRYFHPGWVEPICGRRLAGVTAVPIGQGNTLPDESLRQATRSLSGARGPVEERYGQLAASSLDDAVRQANEGSTQPLRSLIERFKADRLGWDLLAPDAKGRLLRAEAALTLRRGDVAGASRLHEESCLYAVPKDRCQATMIERERGGTVSALGLVEAPLCHAEAHLRAALLIEVQRPAEAGELLSEWSGRDDASEDDAVEGERLRALLAAEARDYDGVIAFIAEVETKRPRNHGVLWTGAVIRFFSAVSWSLPFRPGSYPNPVSEELFRRDPTSLDRLNHAARTFGRLATETEVAAGRHDVLAWRLACLLAHPDRRDEAVTALAELTGLDPPHPGAVAWAVHCGIEVDRRTIVDALTRGVRAGRGTAAHVIAAALLLVTENKPRRALTLTEGLAASLVAPEERELLQPWIDKLRFQTGKGPAPDTPVGRHLVALSALLERGDPSQLISVISQDELEPGALLGSFEALAAKRVWWAINLHRDALLRIGTPQAVEIAAEAAFGDEDYSGCVDLIEANRAAFLAGRLPARLGAVEAWALFHSGRQGDGLARLGSLVGGGDRARASLELARMRLSIGDTEGAAASVVDADGSELPAEAALHLASRLQHVRPDVARQVLGRVRWERLEDAMVAPALGMALGLGVEEAQRSLMPRFDALARSGAPGAWVIEDVDAALEFARAHHEQRTEGGRIARERWLVLDAPAHFAFAHDPLAFARLFRRAFHGTSDGRATGEDHLSLLVRSGHVRGGEPSAMAPAVTTRIRLDVSAILLATEIDILETLDDIFEVWMPPEVVESLVLIEDALAQEHMRAPLYVDAAVAALRDGLVVEGVPTPTEVNVLRLGLEGELPGSEQGLALPDLLRALVVTSGLDGQVASDACRAMSLPDWDDGSPPPELVGIHLTISAWDFLHLVHFGLLGRVSGEVRLWLSEEDAGSLRAMGRDAREVREHLDAVRRTRTFVADRLATERWRVMPSRAVPPELEQAAPLPPLTACLRALGLAEGEPATCAWVEDRLISVGADFGGVARVDVWWVLDRMLAAGRLSARDHRAKVDRLGLAGCGFRAPDVVEVVAALAEAPLLGGEIVESDRLEVVRVAYARQWDDVRYLTGKTVGSNPEWGSEWSFAVRLATFACDVLPAIWNSPATWDAVRREGASQWVWRNLTCRQRRELALGAVTLEPRGLAMAALFRLVLSVYAVRDADGATTRSRRAAYLEWAFLTVVDPLTRRDPDLAETLVGQLADALARDDPPPDRSPGWDDPRIRADAITSLLEPFPTPWRDRILWHPSLRDVVGMRIVEQVDLGSGLVFTLGDFLGAAEAAFLTGGGLARVIGTGLQAEYKVVAEAGPDHAATLSVRIPEVEIHLRDDHLMLAHPDEGLRRSAMARHPDWFDGAGQPVPTCIDSVIAARGPVERSETLTGHRRRSLPWLMGQLASSIRERSECGRTMLSAPTPDVLRGYLRLPSGGPPPEQRGPGQLVFLSAANLVGDLGTSEAVRRLCGVPVDLPPELSAWLLDRIATEGIEAVHAMVGGTPMAAVALATVVASAPSANLGSAASLLSDAATRHAKFHVSFLRWIFREAEGRPEWAVCDPVERAMLLWAHANAVVGTVLAEAGAPDRVVQLLDGGERDDVFRHHARNAPGAPPRSDFLDPNASLSARSWSVAAVAQVFRATAMGPPPCLPPEVTDALRPLVALNVDGRWVAFPEVLVAPKAEDTEHGWFAADPASVTRHIVDLPPPFSMRDAAAMADGIMSGLVEPRTGPETDWTQVWFVDPSRLDREGRARLSSLFFRRGLGHAFDKGGDELLRTLTYRAGLYACDLDAGAMRSMLREACTEAARRLGRPARVRVDLDPSLPSSRWFTAVIEATWAYCSRASDVLTECMREMADCLGAVVTAWPGGLAPALNLLDGITRGTPIDAAGPIWDLVVDLRRQQARACQAD